MYKKLEKVLEKEIKPPKRPFVLMLSGGVDSALLAHYLKPDIVLTCWFPYGKKYDEFEYSKKVVRHLKLDQEVVGITKEMFERDLPHAVRHFRPTTHFSLSPLNIAFRRIATELKIKNVVIAEGPDEYLGGYASYSFLMHEQELYKQEELKNYTYLLDKYLGSPMERFAKILGKEPKELEPYWNKYDYLLSKIGYTDLNLRGIEDMELGLADFWGLKIHYPYMTKKIEKFCFEEVPDEQKINGFTTKWILKRVAEKYLPKEVVWRKNKMGGPVAPVGKWLGEKDEFSKNKYLKLQNEIHRRSSKMGRTK